MDNKIKKRKALLVLPVLVIPFITLAFWAMGGGNGEVGVQTNAAGLNMQLPSAHLKDDKGENKLSFYEEAEKDSAKFREQIKNDPLFQMAPGQDPNEEKVYAKIAELNKQLNTHVSTGEPQQPKSNYVNRDVERLDQAVRLNKDPEAADPEMEQLSGMMDKILDIQHPERIETFAKPVNNFSFLVNAKTAQASFSLLDTAIKDSIGFFGSDNDTISQKENAIEAVVHENQTLVSGAVIQLRLLNDIDINGTHIPKDNFVFGIASLNGERLEAEIHSIRYNHSLFPVNMEVYDMDGLPGIYIPGAIIRDVAKQSADNGLQAMDMTSVDPTLKAQAAAAGVTAAKTLLSRKAKLVRVFVKAGYKILLKNKNQ